MNTGSSVKIREVAVQFGDQQSLCGIISEPATDAAPVKKTAVLFLNSGLIYRIGPNRNYVRIARAIAELGFYCMRFDYSGVGESAPRRDGMPVEQSCVAETRQAMDLLAARYGCDRFILTGICAGADAALLTALADERVAAIAPIDLFTIPSTAYMIDIYKKRLLSLRSWTNLFRGESEIIHIFKKAAVYLTTSRKAENSESVAASPYSLENWRTSLLALLDRRLPIYMIYSHGSPAYYNYCRYFAPSLRPHLGNGLLDVAYFETADHGFTLRYHQVRLQVALCEWLQKLYTSTN